MLEMVIIFSSALWLGILTSISPCPLATNIAAISFLSKKIVHPGVVLVSGITYTIGRMLAYVILGTIIIKSLAGVPLVANFLQKYMNRLLGPVLLIAGLVLLDIVRLNISGLAMSKEKQESFARGGYMGSFALGVLFALAFCPISAAIFFGSLIPLSLNSSYGITLPFIYGVGTGLPVLIFSFGIALGVSTLSHWFRKMAYIEKYTRKTTGIIFILVGIYYIWIYFSAFFKK